MTTIKLYPQADKIVSRDQDSLHTGDYIAVSSIPAHAHDGKKIKEGYPEKGYDDFYVFDPQVTTNKGPKRIPLSSFGSDTDLIQDIVHPKQKSSLVEIASDKSGLKLVFDSNRTFLTRLLLNAVTSMQNRVSCSTRTI